MSLHLRKKNNQRHFQSKVNFKKIVCLALVTKKIAVTECNLKLKSAYFDGFRFYDMKTKSNRENPIKDIFPFFSSPPKPGCKSGHVRKLDDEEKKEKK